MATTLDAAKKIEDIPKFQDVDFGQAKTYHFPRTAGPRSPSYLARQEKKRETKIARRHKEKTRQKRRNHDRKVHCDVNNKVVHESDETDDDVMEMSEDELNGILMEMYHEDREYFPDAPWDYC
jgi:hypothetical protein